MTLERGAVLDAIGSVPVAGSTGPGENGGGGAHSAAGNTNHYYLSCTISQMHHLGYTGFGLVVPPQTTCETNAENFMKLSQVF